MLIPNSQPYSISQVYLEVRYKVMTHGKVDTSQSGKSPLDGLMNRCRRSRNKQSDNRNELGDHFENRRMGEKVETVECS